MLTTTQIAVDWRTTFEAHLASQGRNPKTVAAYLSDLDGFARWYQVANAQPFEPQLTTSIDLRQYREYAVGQMKPATWNRKRIALAIFCNWLRDAGLVTYVLFQGVEPYPEEELPPRWLDAAQLARLLRQVEINVNGAKSDSWRRQAKRDAAIIFLMAFAGLREFEVVALNLGDVQLTERKGRVIIQRGKGDKRREMPLAREPRLTLVDWIKVAGADGRPSLPTSPLFTGKGSDRLTTRSVQRLVKEIGRQAGVDVSPHDLRHTFAKRLIDAGRPLTVVQKLMGHARLETTARYIKPGWADLENAVEGI